MSKPNKRRYKLEQIVTRERNANPGIVIEAGDKTFEVPAPVLWPDAVYEAISAEDPVTAARMLLGDDYDAFTAQGGTAALLLVIVRDSQGVDLPES